MAAPGELREWSACDLVPVSATLTRNPVAPARALHRCTSCGTLQLELMFRDTPHNAPRPRYPPEVLPPSTPHPFGIHRPSVPIRSAGDIPPALDSQGASDDSLPLSPVPIPPFLASRAPATPRDPLAWRPHPAQGRRGPPRVVACRGELLRAARRRSHRRVRKERAGNSNFRFPSPGPSTRMDSPSTPRLT
jgi:hypothetical protein